MGGEGFFGKNPDYDDKDEMEDEITDEIMEDAGKQPEKEKQKECLRLLQD